MKSKIGKSPSYLVRNPYTYCFRMNVPRDLQPYVGKKELRYSLRTGYLGGIGVLITTTSLIAEGFDCKKLSGLFIATPIKSKIKLKQLIGRVLRVDEGKEQPSVFDFLDRHGIFESQYRTRFGVYKECNATFV